MNFDLSSDQKMLVETASSFAKKSSPVTRMRGLREDARGWDPKVWRQMGELGWLGVAFPESLGGFGGRFVDLALVLEQLAMTLVPEPLISSLVLGGMTVLRAGSAEQQQRLVAPMVAGETSLALAWAEADSRYQPAATQTRATRAGAGYRLDGDKRWVLGGHVADHLIVLARTGDGDAGLSLFAVAPGQAGVTVTPVKTLDGRHAAMVNLAGVEVGDDARLGDEGQGAAVMAEVLDLAAAAAAAESVGLAQAVLTMTLDYLRTREQFGVKIGTFQALQHCAVDMFVETELLRSLALEASLRIDEGDADERRAAVSAAKVQLSVGGRLVVKQAIQLFGGIGITEEHDVGLYFKRMQALSSLYGDEEHHVARFAGLPGFRS
jgi:alkylation response protein AidB-like acyl-CoA dehydrogenase